MNKKKNALVVLTLLLLVLALSYFSAFLQEDESGRVIDANTSSAQDDNERESMETNPYLRALQDLYPEETLHHNHPDYGGLYLGDTGIVVCFKKGSASLKQLQQGLEEMPDYLRPESKAILERIKMKEVKYSRKELTEVNEHLEAWMESKEGIFSLGYDIVNNKVVVGIDDLAKEERIRQKLLSDFPQDICSFILYEEYKLF